jgi:hypothetical protein
MAIGPRIRRRGRVPQAVPRQRAVAKRSHAPPRASYFALPLASIAGWLLGASMLVNHWPVAGAAFVAVFAAFLSGCIAALSITPVLVRFWLVIFLSAGTLGFLVQKLEDEQNFRAELPQTGVPRREGGRRDLTVGAHRATTVAPAGRPVADSREKSTGDRLQPDVKPPTTPIETGRLAAASTWIAGPRKKARASGAEQPAAIDPPAEPGGFRRRG